MVWDPMQYERYEALRWRPARDLLEALPAITPARITELGCGTGRLARVLADRFPDASVCGVDGSAAMLAKARAKPSRVTWLEAGIETWRPAEPPDLLISNAALHWLPDHERLFPALADRLAPGGAIAIQVPCNEGAPSHALLRGLCAEPRWVGRLGSVHPQRRVSEAACYHRWLRPTLSSLEIWTTEYLQELDGVSPVLEWMKGSTLVPILERLEDADATAFLEEYGQRLTAAYPPEPDGTTLFPFKRLFIVGRRGG